MTPQELNSEAVAMVSELGVLPDTALAQVAWREQRDNGAARLAAVADWNARLLAQAASLMDGHDDPAKQLLIEACSYCSPSRPSNGINDA